MSKTRFEKNLRKIEKGINFARAWDSKKSLSKHIAKLGKIHADLEMTSCNMGVGYVSAQERDSFKKVVDKVLSEKGIVDGLTLLHKTVGLGMVEESEALINMGADVNAKADVGYQMVEVSPANEFLSGPSASFVIPDYVQQRMENATPLHIAAFNDNVDMCKMLAENGADKTAINGAFETPQDMAKDEKLKAALQPPCKTCKNCTCPTFKYN